MVPSLDSFYSSSKNMFANQSDSQSEHLSRSQTSVTGSPPFGSTDPDFDDASRNAKRTPKACDRCRHKKTKCTGESPCQRCRLDNTVCSFTNRRPKEGPNFNPQVAQKDAAMSMLYKCIEVMNRQILAAKLGPYIDSSLADYAESEDFIIGIILDRFGISPVMDEFDNQPVYLPGQRGFNQENCAVEFPQYSGFRDSYENENGSRGSRFFSSPTAMPHSIPSSASSAYSRDVQMSDSESDFNPTIPPPPQRHATYTYGQQPIPRDQSQVWTHPSKLVDEPLLIQEMYPIEMNGIGSGYLATDPNQRQSVSHSAYQLQQAQIDRIRRSTQPNSRQSPPLGQTSYPGLNRGQIPLPPHIAQVAGEIVEPVVTTGWDFPSAVSTAGASSYPSVLCSARSSPEIGSMRLVNGRKTPSTRPESAIYPSTTAAAGGFMEMANPMGNTIRSMGGW